MKLAANSRRGLSLCQSPLKHFSLRVKKIYFISLEPQCMGIKLYTAHALADLLGQVPLQSRLLTLGVQECYFDSVSVVRMLGRSFGESKQEFVASIRQAGLDNKTATPGR